MTNEPYKTTFAHLSDLKEYVGKELGLSDWFEITQEQINTFAEVTDDHQWIHTKPEMAAKYSPYKTTIAHGFLVLSLASKVAYATYQIEDVVMGVNYGLNRVRFTNAVPVGSFLRGRISLKAYKEIERGAQFVMDLIFEIKGQEKPALVAEWIGQSYVGK